MEKKNFEYMDIVQFVWKKLPTEEMKSVEQAKDIDEEVTEMLMEAFMASQLYNSYEDHIRWFEKSSSAEEIIREAERRKKDKKHLSFSAIS